MQVRRVRLPDATGYSVAVLDEGCWVPVVPTLVEYRAQRGADLPGVSAAAHDTLAFCRSHRAEAHFTSEIAELLTFARDTFGGEDRFGDLEVVAPFRPVAFRDFMLYEQHALGSARGLVRRFLPRVAPAVSLYERVFGAPPRPLRPRRIWYDRPVFYMGNPFSIRSDGDLVPWPSYTNALDYELEIGLVIIRPLSNAAPEKALDAVGAFVLVNDFSARDVQIAEMRSGFGPVKAKNFATAMGTTLVTADEILPRFEDLTGEVRVNGRVWGRGSAAGPQHSLGEMVAYASLGETVLPGELLATGTLPGCSGVETGQWLSAGDEVAISVDGLGTLTNTIGFPEDRGVVDPRIPSGAPNVKSAASSTSGSGSDR